MSLRTKTLSSIGLLNAVLLAIVYGLASQVMIRGFQAAEDKRTYEKMQGIQAALAQRMADLSRLAGDWATSSQTYSFVQHPNDHYIRDNLTAAALTEDKVELALIVNRAGQIVYGTGFMHERKLKLPLPADVQSYLVRHPSVWQLRSTSSAVSGLAFIHAKPMMLASRPIITSDGLGPVVGAVIFGRTLDRDEIGPIEKLADVSIHRFPYTQTALTSDFEQARGQIEKPGSIAVAVVNDDIIGGYTVLPDLSGGPGLLLGAYSQRQIHQQGLISLRYLLICILIYGFAFSLISLLGLEHWVLGPLLRLSAAFVHIGATQDVSQRVARTGDDELGSLAAEINVALSSIESFQKQLHDRGLEFAAILDHTAVPLVVLDDDCTIQRANPAMYGLAAREPGVPAQGLRLGEFLDCAIAMAGGGKCGTHEQCRACAVCAAIQDTIQTGADYDRVPGSMLISRHGVNEECYLLLSTTRFETGGHRRVLVCLEDVTDIRKAEAALRVSEQRFRELADLLPDMVYEANADFRFTYANRTALETLGYSQEDLDRGLVLADTIPPDQTPLAECAMAQALATGEPSLGQFDVVCKDGRTLPCEVHSVALCDSDGVLTGYRGVLRDISERKQIEESQRLAAIGHLAAGVAHEFNNILAAMRLMAEVARSRGGAADKLIDTVLAGAELGGAICRKLSRFARPALPKREPIPIEAPVEAALAMAAHELENSGIEVHRDYQHGDTLVYGDASQLEQVFLNLAINSCHAMPQGGVLTIETALVSGAYDEVVITVSDTGLGIRTDDLPHVFEPFFTTKRGEADDQVTGTGLGLSVSHRIVTAHGGLMTARSQWGVGTAVEVRLLAYAFPEDEDDDGDAAFASSGNGDEEAAPQTPAPSGRRILLVEDVATVRDAMAILLTQAGHVVTTASTTDEALDRLGTDRFDLIIADLILKGGGGREVLAASRFMAEPPPVVIITGMNDEVAIAEAMALGAKRCVRKPFKMEEVLEAVDEACPQPRP